MEKVQALMRPIFVNLVVTKSKSLHGACLKMSIRSTFFKNCDKDFLNATYYLSTIKNAFLEALSPCYFQNWENYLIGLLIIF